MTDAPLEIKLRKLWNFDILTGVPLKDWLPKTEESYEILELGWVDKNRAEEEGVDKNHSEFSQQV